VRERDDEAADGAAYRLRYYRDVDMATSAIIAEEHYTARASAYDIVLRHHMLLRRLSMVVIVLRKTESRLRRLR